MNVLRPDMLEHGVETDIANCLDQILPLDPKRLTFVPGRPAAIRAIAIRPLIPKL